jgi:hypothetical protein
LKKKRVKILLLNLIKETQYFPPFPFLRVSIQQVDSALHGSIWRSLQKVAESRRGVVGGGLGSPLAGFCQNTEISFLMISPKLLDICPAFLLVFSPIKTAVLLILF